jgi:signal transduction histidine kinase
VTATLRFRITLLATLVTLVVLAASGVALVVGQRHFLVRDLQNALQQRADDLEELVVADRVPARLGAVVDDTATQVVTLDGAVVAASPNLDSAPGPIAAAPERAQRDVLRTVDGLPVDDDSFRVLSRRVETPAGDRVIHVAGSLDEIGESGAVLRRLLLILVPAVTALLAALVWWLIGRTLRPVEEAARREQRFVADASHELRSPLTRIRSEIEVDLAHPEGADLVATHRSVLEEASAMELLVDDLLHLARRDAGRADAADAPVDLDDIVLRQVTRLRAEGRLQVDATDVSAAQVQGDGAALERAVANLVENAVSYARTMVVLTLAERDGAAVLVVGDDGPGIPREQHEVVFERFARLDDARSRTTGGTGLGLAIAREIARHHGGDLTIDGEHTGGARFVLSLPLSRTA